MRPVQRIFLIVIILFFFNQRASASTQAQNDRLPLVQSGAQGVSLTWTLPEYTISPQTIAGVSYSRLTMAGLTAGGEPGWPELPRYSRLIGLPPAGSARVEIVELRQETVSLPLPPLPAAGPQPLTPAEMESHRLPTAGPVVRQPEPTVYQTDQLYPAEAVALGPPHQVRDQRLAVLTITPLQVNPVNRTLRVVTYLRLEIIFSEVPPLAAKQSEPLAGLDRALQAVLLNPEALGWSAPPAPVAARPPAAEAVGNSLKIVTNSGGLYALTYTDLQNASFPVASLNPQTLKLTRGYPRQEVAVLVEGQGDGSFDPADRLLFYAPPPTSRFVEVEAHFLSYGGAAGLRMATRSGAPLGAAGTAWRTVIAESNSFYEPLYAGRDGDHWFWAKLATPNSLTGSYGISLDRPPLASGPAATLTLWLQGYTSSSVQNPDHQVAVGFNGSLVGTISWDGKNPITATLSVPWQLLRSGQNQVSLTIPGLPGVFAEGMWLDAMQLRYAINQAGGTPLHFSGDSDQKQYSIGGWSGSLLAFDITDSRLPQQVTGFSLVGDTLTIGDAGPTPAAYFVTPITQVKKPLAIQPAQTIAAPPGGSDYIVISPASLAAAVAPLVSHRANQGLRVAHLNVEAIYDAYGDGRMDSTAIRNFLSHAYQSWPAPAPLYVLLVGDGSYDFKNYSGFDPVNLIPPHLVAVDPWWGETAADNRLVTLSGDDLLPEMLIGRLPVNTAAETTTVVNKIIAYETNPPAGSWRRTQLFISDNPDGAGDFHSEAEASYQAMAGALLGKRFYYGDTVSGQPYVYTNVSSLHTDFVTAFNQGSSLATFYGHSSWHQWAAESLLHVDDLEQLNNQDRLPVVVEMTCFTGFFHHAEYPTLDESLLRQSGGGAVAVWASTGLGVGTGHRQLQEGFNRAVMQQGETTLGAAVLAGKLQLFAAGYYLDLLDTYTLLGDPAMSLAAVLQPDVQLSQQLLTPEVQPGQTVRFRLTVRNIGIGTAQTLQLTNLLPGGIMAPSWSSTDSRVTLKNGLYRWDLPDLTPGETVEITVSGTIDPTLPPDFALINAASLTVGSAELDTHNNTSTLIIGGERLYFPLVRR